MLLILESKQIFGPIQISIYKSVETPIVFQISKNTSQEFDENRPEKIYLQDAFEVFGKSTEFTTDLLEVSSN